MIQTRSSLGLSQTTLTPPLHFIAQKQDEVLFRDTGLGAKGLWSPSSSSSAPLVFNKYLIVLGLGFLAYKEEGHRAANSRINQADTWDIPVWSQQR
jgi:hypothetical protein